MGEIVEKEKQVMDKTQSKIQKKKVDLTEGSVSKGLLAFAIPMILGNIFQQLYNIVDSIIVGKMVGADALAAVGASTSINMLFVMVAVGTGIGCSVVISQLFGAKRMEELKTAICTALMSILVFSIILSIIGRMLSVPILTIMKTPENIMADATNYLNIYFYGFFFLFLYNAFTSVFNALGDSKKPLYFLIFSSFVNIGLDLFFVGKLKMGVAGAAWATLIAQALSALLSFLVLTKKIRGIQSREYKKFDLQMLKNMSKVAFPTILQQSIVSIGMLLIQGAVNQFGSVFLAGYTAAVRVDGLAIIPIVNLGNAVSTFVAQNAGAGKFERIPKGYHVGLAAGMCFGAFIGIMMQVFGTDLIGLFMDANDAAASIEIGAKYIGIISIFYFVFAMMNMSSAVLRGTGDMFVFTLSAFVNLIVRVSLTYIFAVATAGMVIMWANPVGWAVSFTISYTRYKMGKWREIKLV